MLLHGTSLTVIGMHHYRSSSRLRPRSSRLDLLREPLYSSAHTACEHVPTLESSGDFNCSGGGPACGEIGASRTYIERWLSTLSNEIKEMRLQTGSAPIPSSSLRVGSERRLGPPCLWDRYQTTGETNCCIVQGDIAIHPGPKRALPLRGRDILVQDFPPTTAQKLWWDRCRSRKYLKVRDIHGLEELLNHGLHELGHLSAFNIFQPASTGSEAVALLIIGFSFAIYHHHDADVGGPLKRPLNDTFMKAPSHFTKTNSPRLSALEDLAPRFLAEEDHGESSRRSQQPPHCNGKGRGVSSNLRSGVEQQSFAHSVSPLGALPLSLSDVGRKKVHTDDAKSERQKVFVADAFSSKVRCAALVRFFTR